MKEQFSESLLLCPVCKSRLIKDAPNRMYRCDNKHTYDIAKEGYVNLLMSNQKKSKNPGDSKEMVLARADFLNRGFYGPLSEKINELIAECLPKDRAYPISIMDIGCGEGYYLTNLRESNDKKNIKAKYYGIDVSKEAIKYAGKTDSECTWMVGNNFHIPVGDESVECMFSVFSPIEMEECKRVLKDNGFFIRVLPRPNHLIQLRNIIYSEVSFKESEVYQMETDDIDYIKECNVTFDMMLEKEEILSLLKMTPHYWRTSAEKRQALDLYESLSVTVDMRIGIFQKSINS